MKRTTAFFTTALLIAFAAAAQRNIPVEGAEGATLRGIAGTETLVTLVLKPSGAQDKNLRIVELLSDTMTVMDENGDRSAYLYGTIEKVIVQGGKVQADRFILSDSRALTVDQKQIYQRAVARAREIAQQSNDDQAVRILANSVLAADGDQEAMKYLESLARSNNIRTRFDAAQALYLVGKSPSEDMIQQGLSSGSRLVRGQAAHLAGLTGRHDATAALTTMLADRKADLSAPAAVALARLGDRGIIPALLNMIGELSEEKGEAAVRAFVILGGDDVIDQLTLSVENESGQTWYRMVRVLHELGTPIGQELLLKAYNDYPTIKIDAAQRLAAQGDWDATQFLRDRLKRRIDPTLINLSSRAKTAAALYQGGDISAKAVLQSLTREPRPLVRLLVATIAIDLADRSLFPVVQPLVEDTRADVATEACMAVTALANADYRTRLAALRN